METRSAVEVDGVVHWVGGRSEGRMVVGKVLIGFDEVVLGVFVVVATDLVAIARLEDGEDIVEEVEDFDGGVVGQVRQAQRRSQIMFAHGRSSGVGQRAAALRRAAEESGGAKTSR